MESPQLVRKDWLFIGICLAILTAGLTVSLLYFPMAFPEATIQFRYNKPQSERIATSFLDKLGAPPPTSYYHAGVFGHDYTAKTYLEKELGIDSARHYLGHPVRLWYWRHRWFKPGSKEEYSVFVTPEGEVVRFNHELEETAAGPDLDEATARHRAEGFLFGTMQRDSGRLAFIESERTGRPHRSDWNFTWKAAGIEPVKGSDYRYRVRIQGDQIGEYAEFLHVPEAWWASYKKLRSYNELAGSAASIGMVATVLAMIVVVFLRLRSHDLRWRLAIRFGAVGFLLLLLNQVNELPLNLYGYETTTSWSGFWVSTIWEGLLSAVGAGMVIVLLTVSAETLYREKYPNFLSLSKTFSLKALQTKALFKSILLGTTMTAFFFAYQVGFYVIAGHYGAWSPSDVPYDNLLNTSMPWLAVLFMGFFPAVSEEFISRAFSIPLLQKLLRNRMTWVAVVVPALIWGFGHSTYPNEPFWIRGVEVGIAGILIGVIVLRFGILAALIWHYTVDALYTAMLLFRSDNPYFIFTAAVAAGLLILPLVVSIYGYWRRGGFAPESDLTNAHDATVPVVRENPDPMEAPAPPQDHAVEAIHYRPWSRPQRVMVAALIVLGGAAMILPISSLGDFRRYVIPKQQAVRVFSDSLRASGWADPDTLAVAAFSRGSHEGRGADETLIYLLKELKSVDKFNRLADQTLGIGRWQVLAWKAEDRRRFAGSVNGRTGQIQGLYALLPEEAAGDSISPEQAQHLVDSVLTRQGEDLSKLDLKEHSSEVKPHRVDHVFTYEARDGDPRHIGEARYRRDGSLDGQYLTVRTKPWFRIPEQWSRERQATTTIRSLRRGLLVGLIGGLMVWATTLFLIRARTGAIAWKKSARWAIAPAVVVLIGGLNDFYLSGAEYFTRIEIPQAVFRSTVAIDWLASGAMAYLLFGLGLAFIQAMYPDGWTALRARERRASLPDAALALLSGGGAAAIFSGVAAALNAWRPDWATLPDMAAAGWVAAPLPLTTLAGNVLVTVMAVVTMAVFAMVAWEALANKGWLRAILVAAVIALLFPAGAVDAGEWALGAVKGIVAAGLIYAVLRFALAGRPLLLICAAIGFSVFRVIGGALAYDNSLVRTHAILLAVFILGGVWWWLQRPDNSKA